MLEKEFFDYLAQSAEAIKYTDCISTEEYDPTNEWPDYDIKQCGGEAAVMLELWRIRSSLLLHFTVCKLNF